MFAPTRRLRSWLSLTAFTAAVGVLWTETEARACAGSPPAVQKAGSCCKSAADAACCCLGSADQQPAPAHHADARTLACSTADLNGSSTCVCVQNESSPADRSSRPSGSTTDSRSSGDVAGSATLEADASPQTFAPLHPTPFDPLGPTVLLRTSRLRF